MAHFSLIGTPKGPVLYVHVGLTSARIAALQAANQTVPLPQLAEMLIDTGASHTSIDSTIVTALGLTPTGTMQMLTPSTGATPVTVPTYDVGLVVLGGVGGGQHVIPVHSVSGCDFSAQGIGGLLGRDFLANARLIYSGADNLTLLSF